MSDDLSTAELPDPDLVYDGLTCRCGSQWFSSPAITLWGNGRVSGYMTPLTCVKCGAER